MVSIMKDLIRNQALKKAFYFETPWLLVKFNLIYGHRKFDVNQRLSKTQFELHLYMF